ncbi:ubiquitin-like protein ISG15 [Sceloporus undulatus]|uniref:ubiquitin-like protein ISG15 n=1 Tax=Sceloporus undulatus TaxID=8520 RepID=UPI001C4CD030|nr:ubiquitin-like protein ISG15 [Sceloporus undulatus]
MALHLNVKLLTGELHSLTIAPNKTVWDFKALVEQKTGHSRYQQKLASPKSPSLDFQDGAELSACGLQSGDTLFLLLKNEESMTVFLKNAGGRTNTYQVLPSDRVSQFKARVQQQENILSTQFWLLYEGQILDNEDLKLADYKIAPGGTIYLNLRVRGGWGVADPDPVGSPN